MELVIILTHQVLYDFQKWSILVWSLKNWLEMSFMQHFPKQQHSDIFPFRKNDAIQIHVRLVRLVLPCESNYRILLKKFKCLWLCVSLLISYLMSIVILSVWVQNFPIKSITCRWVTGIWLRFVWSGFWWWICPFNSDRWGERLLVIELRSGSWYTNCYKHTQSLE